MHENVHLIAQNGAAPLKEMGQSDPSVSDKDSLDISGGKT